MPTIQIRNVSAEAHEAICQRAQLQGQSIQGYMKQEIERMAFEPDEDVIFAAVERFVNTHGIHLDVEALLDDLDAERR